MPATLPRTKTCPACGNDMVRDTRPDTIAYKGLTAKVRQPGWYCTKCDEAVIESADARATEKAFVALKACADGLLPSEKIAAIRAKLGLSQRRAGEVLGGGPRAFQKYESTAIPVSHPMDSLLRILDVHPDALDVLLRRKAGEKLKPRAKAMRGNRRATAIRAVAVKVGPRESRG